MQRILKFRQKLLRIAKYDSFRLLLVLTQILNSFPFCSVCCKDWYMLAMKNFLRGYKNNVTTRNWCHLRLTLDYESTQNEVQREFNPEGGCVSGSLSVAKFYISVVRTVQVSACVLLASLVANRFGDVNQVLIRQVVED